MARTPLDVTEAELAILQVLWTQGPETIRGISEVLYPNDTAKKCSTVKRLLARLEKKGYVQRDRSGPLQTFSALRSRDDLVGHRLETLVESLCEGTISPLLTHLSTADTLTAEQQETLRRLVRELQEESEDSA
jgi:BlaI family transcriptional regulator, penicillinase repressor